MNLRDYQQESIDALFAWWAKHPEPKDIPILWLPTGAGKSVVIAALVARLFQQWPDEHPRTLVIVPSKELAEQNAEKLVNMLPLHVSVGYYSASVGQKAPHADVIVATIGTVAKAAHLLGNIKAVLIDECHLVNPDGAGNYRSFLAELARYCRFRVAGTTATPFRGNGIWLTDGKDPLFTGIAHEVPVRQLLDVGYLAPLVRPADVLTQIDASGVATTNGDYNVGQLADCVDVYLDSAAQDVVRLAADRRQWIAFCPTVANAQRFAARLATLGISADVVVGDSPTSEREARIARFRAGDTRCLVTVLALATGFDVPTVDCIIWLRPTKSPVLYIQGAGRGLRIAPGKTDCLWLDFSDTTERLGPIDTIRGRKRTGKQKGEAPFAVCDNCGAQVRPASLLRCPECDHLMREEEALKAHQASNAAILSAQVKSKVVRYPVDRVTYARHEKTGGIPSLRVEYWFGLRIVGREWVCLEHTTYAGERARRWWAQRSPEGSTYMPNSVDQALKWIEHGFAFTVPVAITINESGRYPEISGYEWPTATDTENIASGNAVTA